MPGITQVVVAALYRITVGAGVESALISAWVIHDWHGEPVNAAPDEHDDMRWFSLDDLPSHADMPGRAALLDALAG